jgi:hypothetical protein
MQAPLFQKVSSVDKRTAGHFSPDTILPTDTICKKRISKVVKVRKKRAHFDHSGVPNRGIIQIDTCDIGAHNVERRQLRDGDGDEQGEYKSTEEEDSARE